MKKSLFMVAVFVSSLSMAQSTTIVATNSKPLRFGLKLGINIAKLTDSEDSGVDTKPRTGINVGAYIHYKISEKFAFRPELIYTTQGLVQDGNSNNIDIKITYKMDYIAIPLMAKYYPAKNFNIEFGPQLAFNVKKQIEAKGNGQTLDWDTDNFFDDNNIDAKTNTFDLGLNFGLGYELDNGINFGARYSLGLIKVFEGDGVVDSTGSSQSIKNSVFSFGLGYTFK